MKDLIELLDKAINAEDLEELADLLEKADELFSEKYLEQTTLPFMITIRRATSDARYVYQAIQCGGIHRSDLYAKHYAIMAKKNAEAAKEILKTINRKIRSGGKR